ncbi:MAG TPA: hypothetical protein VF188_07120, partial [Longimicrobiales bacterium]
MKQRSRVVLALAFAGAFFAVGLPYWRLPYKELSLPSDLLGYGLVAVAALAFTACIAGGVRLLPAVVVIG